MRFFSTGPIVIPTAKEVALTLDLELDQVNCDQSKQVAQDAELLKQKVLKAIQVMIEKRADLGGFELDLGDRMPHPDAITQVRDEMMRLGYGVFWDKTSQTFTFTSHPELIRKLTSAEFDE